MVVPLAGDRQATARLLDAVISVSRELRLREALHRIVGYACELVDARDGFYQAIEETTGPPKEPFLGVPLRIQDDVIGTVYVTDKIGGGGFTPDDVANLNALATAARIAVENARLYERSRQRERWLQASNEIQRSDRKSVV